MHRNIVNNKNNLLGTTKAIEKTSDKLNSIWHNLKYGEFIFQELPKEVRTNFVSFRVDQ